MLGLLIAIVGTIGGFLFEGGELIGLISVASALIVLGATIGAVFISFPMSELKEIPRLLKLIFTEQNTDYTSLINKITELANIARKEGILALEPLTQEIENKFLANGIIMVVDGMDKEATKSIMEAEINAVAERHARRAKIFEAAGGYCPTMGIVGTVMSMISLLKDLDEPSTLGPKIAMAFTATLYGVAFANILFLPFAEKLKSKSGAELVYMEMCTEGILSIQAGESPKIIGEKLSVFINQVKRTDTEEEEKKDV